MTFRQSSLLTDPAITVRCDLCNHDCEYTGQVMFVCGDCRDTLRHVRNAGWVLLGILTHLVFGVLGYLTCVGMTK